MKLSLEKLRSLTGRFSFRTDGDFESEECFRELKLERCEFCLLRFTFFLWIGYIDII